MPRTYRSEAVIEASPEAIWDVLIDLPAYPDWNPFTVEVVSSLKEGEPIDLTVILRGRRVTQRETVRTAERPHKLVWGMDGLLVHAERVQTLEVLADGCTKYVTIDTIGGPLGFVVEWLHGESLRSGFVRLSEALAERLSVLNNE